MTQPVKVAVGLLLTAALVGMIASLLLLNKPLTSAIVGTVAIGCGVAATVLANRSEGGGPPD